jgi:hypothetical protein
VKLGDEVESDQIIRLLHVLEGNIPHSWYFIHECRILRVSSINFDNWLY